ncbi:MAG: hypothetical protein IPK15_13535 [Verrucomicrobia bacterium]|nr:hypothetical protein [Verrucomicrobiota bacterium]
MLSVGVTNTGNYRAIVSNEYGAVTSVVAAVIVHPALANAGWVDQSFDVGMGFNGHVRRWLFSAMARFSSAVRSIPSTNSRWPA